MSNSNTEVRALDLSEIEQVSGGTTSFVNYSTIVIPHIPLAKDLLTQDQIAKLLSLNGGFVPPIPHS